jgi:hypothetical protein
MIRKSLFLAAVLGLGWILTTSYTQADPVPIYWCVFQCVDGTEGGGPAHDMTECKRLADSQCRGHGGTRMTGLDPYTPPTPN